MLFGLGQVLVGRHDFMEHGAKVEDLRVLLQPSALERREKLEVIEEVGEIAQAESRSVNPFALLIRERAPRTRPRGCS